jgi:archaellum biogenesis protein FlaJ (TadC family)
MIIAAFVCFIAGTLLGMRFKVAILLPVMFAVAAAILPFGILTGQKFAFIISLELVMLTALQLGYLSTALIVARAARKNYAPHGATPHHSR